MFEESAKAYEKDNDCQVISISRETMECFSKWKKANIPKSEQEDMTIEEFVRRNLDALGYLE